MLSSMPLGRTGLRVPRLAVGTSPLGNLFHAVSDAQAIETVQYALAHGMPFLDTAPLYGKGLSERRLGVALEGIPRDSYVLASKVGRLVTPDGVSFDFSRDGVLRSIEASLERLHLDRIDLLHIHNPANYYRQALDETFPTLAELRRQGVIRAIGVGMEDLTLLADFARAADFDCLLLVGHYTLVEQDALDELLPLCQKQGIGIFLGSVFHRGILATGPIPGVKYGSREAKPDVFERATRIDLICRRYAVPLRVASLQFPLAHPAITSILVGLESAQQVRESLDALQVPIPPEFWADLRAAALLHPSAPVYPVAIHD